MSNHPNNDDKRLLELLERWHSGDFSITEEQELLALADSDEFRREVVEGFWSLPETDHASHLASLQTRLRKQSFSTRIVTFPRFVAAVAALGLLILAVVWLIPNAEPLAPIAQTERSKPADNQPDTPNATASTPKSEETPVNRSPRLDQVPRSAPRNQREALAKDNGLAGSDVLDEVASAPAPEPEESASDKMLAAKPAVQSEGYAKVLDTQDDVDFAPGNMAKRAEAKKEASARSKEKDGQKSKMPLASGTSQPADGWSNFQDYLRRNARLPEPARQNNISGSVKLKFLLDANNQPVDFHILRSLGYGCDEEAIRLVKDYDWQLGNTPEITLEVPFVR